MSGSPGIVDLVSFEVMSRLGLTAAFTNDRHFTAKGFTTLF
jgi:predicted nucleic acid-binding protein